MKNIQSYMETYLYWGINFFRLLLLVAIINIPIYLVACFISNDFNWLVHIIYQDNYPAQVMIRLVLAGAAIVDLSVCIEIYYNDDRWF